MPTSLVDSAQPFDKRTNQVMLRFTQPELQHITAKARNANATSVSSYIRETILDTPAAQSAEARQHQLSQAITAVQDLHEDLRQIHQYLNQKNPAAFSQEDRHWLRETLVTLQTNLDAIHADFEKYTTRTDDCREILLGLIDHNKAELTTLTMALRLHGQSRQAS
ncbi:MAG TPA: hypothetical protein VNL71_02245 [Chloroflexota bacterium]|nr:hypothetical protein [Chloroflexota bacterium]